MWSGGGLWGWGNRSVPKPKLLRSIIVVYQMMPLSCGMNLSRKIKIEKNNNFMWRVGVGKLLCT